MKSITNNFNFFQKNNRNYGLLDLSGTGTTIINNVFNVSGGSTNPLYTDDIFEFTTGGGITIHDNTDFLENTFLSGILDNSVFVNAADPTKKMTFNLSGVTSGNTRTLIIPDQDGEITLNNGNQILRNKNITDPSNTVMATFLKTLSGSVKVDNNNAFNGGVLTATSSSGATWQSIPAAEVTSSSTNNFSNKNITDPSNTVMATFLKSLSGSVKVDNNNSFMGAVLTATSSSGATWQNIPAPEVSNNSTNILSNKSVIDNSFFILDNLNQSKRLNFECSPISASGTVVLSAPTQSGEIITNSGTQTMSNKTFSNNINLSADNTVNIGSTTNRAANTFTNNINVGPNQTMLATGGRVNILGSPSSGASGPHVTFYTDNSGYPVCQQFFHGPDNMGTMYDSYWDAGFTSGHNSNGYLIFKNSGRLQFSTAPASAPGTARSFINRATLDQLGFLQMQFTPNGYIRYNTSGSFYTDIFAANPSANRVISYPDATGFVVLNDNNTTLTNKTFGSSILASADNTINIGSTTSRFADTFTHQLRVGTNQTTTSPTRFMITGANNNIATGPNIQTYTSADSQPLFQLMSLHHNNIFLGFDQYFNGTNFVAGHTTKSYSIYKDGNVLKFSSSPATTAGATVTRTDHAVLNENGFDLINMSFPGANLSWSNGANSTALRAISATAPRTISLPNATGTLSLLDNTETLSNKTFSNTINFSADNTASLGSLTNRAGDTWTHRLRVGPNTPAFGGLISPVRTMLTGANINVPNGPHINAYTDDNFPVFQQLNWAHGTICQGFDTYFDGNWRAGHTTAGFIQRKEANQFLFQTTAVTTAGSSVTPVNRAVLEVNGFSNIQMSAPTSTLQWNSGANTTVLRATTPTANRTLDLPNESGTLAIFSSTSTTLDTTTAITRNITLDFTRIGNLITVRLRDNSGGATNIGFTDSITIPVAGTPVGWRPAIETNCTAYASYGGNTIQIRLIIESSGVVIIQRHENNNTVPFQSGVPFRFLTSTYSYFA